MKCIQLATMTALTVFCYYGAISTISGLIAEKLIKNVTLQFSRTEFRLHQKWTHLHSNKKEMKKHATQECLTFC